MNSEQQSVALVFQLAESDPSWTQSTLPVRHGGLGIRSAVQLAPSAFLASASSGLAHLILPANLPANMQPPQLSYVDEALAAWSQGCQEQPPTDAAAHHQKTWDTIRVSSIADTLFTDSSDPMHRARFLAASCKESGAWLNALPVTSLGLRMDNATMRISMGLRLGLPLCQSHTCQHCGAEVTQFATHGLSCRKSACRTPSPPFSCERDHTQSFGFSTCSITFGAFRSVSFRCEAT